ncbi:MAG: hypothetical protein ACYCX3_01995 [Thermoleophilia bacterium]
MKRSAAGIMMAVGVVALVAVAWLYLQDQQQASSGVAAQTADSGGSAATDQGGPVDGAAPAVVPPTQQSGASSYVAQDEGAGNVKVMAAALTPGALKEDASLSEMAAQFDPATELGFMVSFETHSGDLSQLDLVELSTLGAPDGDHQAVRWVTESDSGHHRSGTLVFDRGGLDLSAPGDLTLTVRDVAGVPSRTLTWRLPLS